VVLVASVALFVAIVLLRLVGVVPPGFTGEDWYQLTQGPDFFLTGLSGGYLFSAPRTAASNVSFTRVLVIDVRQRGPMVPTSPRTNRQPTADAEPWLILVAIAIASVLLAWAYVEGREIGLAVVTALLALTLGLTAGIVVRRMELGWFAGDWVVALAGGLVFTTAALASGYFLLDPPWAPPAYAALFDAYRREGLDAFSAFDNITHFFAYQAMGALALIAASALLFVLAISLVAKGNLLGGATPSRFRLTLARSVIDLRRVRSLVFAVAVLETTAFVAGSGLLTRLAGRTSLPETPRLLTPVVERGAKRLSVTAVATSDGTLAIGVRTRGRRQQLRRISISPGRMTWRHRLPEFARKDSVVVLTTRGGRNPSVDVRRFRCSSRRCRQTASSPPR
jgi:hypothetical protein